MKLTPEADEDNPPEVMAIHQDDATDFSPACFDDLARDHLQKKVDRLRAEKAELVQQLAALHLRRGVPLQGLPESKALVAVLGQV